MPYIDKELRPDLDAGKRQPVNAGELTYCLYRAALLSEEKYADTHTDFKKKCHELCANYLRSGQTCYQRLCEIIGSLICTSLEISSRFDRFDEFDELLVDLAEVVDEFYEFRVSPYEDTKRYSNGDVTV